MDSRTSMPPARAIPRRRFLGLALSSGLAVSLNPQFLAAEGVVQNKLTMMASPDLLKRTIPSSGESIAAVGLGTWQTFDAGENPELRGPLEEVLKTLIQHGGSVVDSSPMYGRSESVVGELSTAAGINDKLFMATKVWTRGEQEGIRQMNQSFARLQRKTIDLLQIHNLVDWKTQLKTLRSWKDQGKIRYIGITHYTESAYRDMEAILRAEPLDFLQINYSLIRRHADERLFPLAREKKVAVLVNQPFQEGELFRMVKGKALPEWSEAFCSSWGQYFLKFVLGQDAVTCVIPGTSKPHHMLDNLGAALGRLPTEKERVQMIRHLQI